MWILRRPLQDLILSVQVLNQFCYFHSQYSLPRKSGRWIETKPFLSCLLLPYNFYNFNNLDACCDASADDHDNLVMQTSFRNYTISGRLIKCLNKPTVFYLVAVLIGFKLFFSGKFVNERNSKVCSNNSFKLFEFDCLLCKQVMAIIETSDTFRYSFGWPP